MWKRNGITWNGKSVVVGDRRIFNPTDEHLKAAGYVWEEPIVIEPVVPDTSEFDAACVKFREVCGAIGELIGNPNFRGGFDEMAEFETSEAAMSETGVALSIKWMAADKLCTYLAGKLGIGQPEWWYKCWEDN
jgi:hypothetical protein